MGVLQLRLLRRGLKLDGALWYGKVATTVFYVMMTVLVAFPNLPIPAINVLVGTTGLFSLFAFLMYLRVFWGMFHRLGQRKRDASEPSGGSLCQDGPKS